MPQKQEVNSTSGGGMKRSLNIRDLQPTDHTIAINVNFQNDSGDTNVLKIEASNLLATEFKPGYKVIGFRNDITTNSTYFFLANPETGLSEFGRILDNQTIPDLGDSDIVSCSDCDKRIDLSEPLENQIQVATQLYETLLSDCEDNKCLNLSVLHPIKESNIQIKNEKCGNTLYFTDNYNPPRYIQLDNLDIYSFEGDINCSEDNRVATCLNCERLRMFRLFEEAQIAPTEIVVGGSLPMGSYEFIGAYCDNQGNELSEYSSLTQPVNIFDFNDTVLEQQELNKKTNFAIKLQLQNLDRTFDYYKIAVIQTTSLDGATRYYEEGVHPITDTTVLYTTDQGKKVTDLNTLFLVKPDIIKIKGLSQANDYLIPYGMEYEKEVNLQPVVNLMGGFLKWQTHITTEEYYKQAIAEKGYMRDETYGFAIRFKTRKGNPTAIFPFISRPATLTDSEAIDNKDTDSLNNPLNPCSKIQRNKRYQVYNTATVEGSCLPEGSLNTNLITEDLSSSCIIENVSQSQNQTFIVEDVENFISLEDTINLILEEGICKNYPFCDAIDLTEDDSCTPNFESGCEDIIKVRDFFEVNEIEGEILTNIYADFPEDYPSLYYTGRADIYRLDDEGNAIYEDGVPIYNYSYPNKKPFYAQALLPLQDNTREVSNGYFHEEFNGPTTLEEATEENFTTGCTEVFQENYFAGNVHKNSLWFEVDTSEYPAFIFDVSKSKRSDAIAITPKLEKMRISVFTNRSGGAAIFCDTFDISDFYTVLIEKEGDTVNFYKDDQVLFSSIEVDSRKLYFAVETPVVNLFEFSQGFVVSPHSTVFGVAIRNKQVESIQASYENISFNRVQKYEASCTTEIPIVDECTLLPYEVGSFAYTESSVEYPDNEELYNSSAIIVSPSDFPKQTNLEQFEVMYAEETTELEKAEPNFNYILKQDTNFTCTPIKHFKFPDNSISPFMGTNRQVGFSPTTVFPMGVTIDNDVINSFLDIAVNNGLISQEKRDDIVGYEIFRSDRTLDKSIIAKGLLYDMYQYKEDNRSIDYPNYPYNDLGDDILNLQEDGRSNIPHPFQGDSNHKFTFSSPNTSFLNPTLPTELKIDGIMKGNTRGSFDEVENHSKWVILGDEAIRLAKRLATLEVIAEAAIVAAQSAEVYRFDVGVVVSTNIVGIIFNVAATALNAAAAAVFKYGRYKKEWIDNFYNLGQPHNFAYYYSSEGYYNYLKHLQPEGEKIRSITKSEYLKQGRKIVVDSVSGEKIEINNYDRENSVFLNVGKDFEIEYDQEYKDFDNNKINRTSSSRTIISQNLDCTEGRSAEIIRNVASMYATLKNFNLSQYGTIDSVKWLTTSYNGDLSKSEECLPIFGGDVYISRFAEKRKIPLFLRDAYDLAARTPFNYKANSNIGTEPRYYCNYRVSNNVNLDRGFPDIKSEYEFDCIEGSRNFYVKPPSKFYLYYYGIPNFLVESEMNLNFRYGKKQPEENFYPNVGDYMEWTQQKVVPIKERNRFFYNFIYSKSVSPSLSRTLPSTYNKEDYDCRFDEPNGGIYSLQDNSENDLYDPWLVFRPLDKFNFSSSNGLLTEIRGIENDQVLARFEDTMEVHNAVDTTVDDGSRPETKVLGNGGLFSRRTRDFSKTDLGKYGSQSTEMSSNEFGHFFVDAKRGSVIQVMPSSAGLREISKEGSQRRPNGMSDWFKEHLPFKILKSNIANSESIDIDNPYNGVGITVGFDDRYKRVFFTKKDYVPKVSGIVHENGVYTLNDVEIELNDTQYFDDASWTLAYSPLRQEWISYYDFKPNYYIAHTDYFQTGLSDKGLWSHNLTNKSFGVFYGEYFPSMVTYATKNDLKENNLNTVMFKSDAERYHNKYDSAYNPDITFNKAVIWSTRENSGNLELIPQKTLSQVSKYPITKNGTTQEILITNSQELWSFDYFWNRVKRENSNQPIWNKDINDIGKTINSNIVSMYGKPVLEPLSATAFYVTLIYDKDSRYEVDLQWAINTEST